MIEIRSNISPMVFAHMQAEEDRKAREEAERQARLEKEKLEREEKERRFKEEHPNLAAHTYISYSTYPTYNDSYSGYCKIHFYEWSEINSKPIEFTNYASFYKFLDECGLLFTPEQNQLIRPLSECFVVCKPNSGDMVVGKTYEEMCREYRLAENLVKMMTMA